MAQCILASTDFFLAHARLMRIVLKTCQCIHVFVSHFVMELPTYVKHSLKQGYHAHCAVQCYRLRYSRMAHFV